MNGVIADFGKELGKLTTENKVSSEFLIQPDLIEGIFKKLSPIKGMTKSS